MKRFELNAMPRVEGGKKALKALRAQGCVPAVLNGGKVVELIGEFDLIISPFWYYTYNIAFATYHGLKNLKKKITKK